jgi:hypothetical protein
MMARNAISIVSAVLAALLTGGCHKDHPATPAAPTGQIPSTDQSKPKVVALPTHEGQGYVGLLLKSRDMAKMAVSQSNLANLSQAMTAYAIEKDGKFPASLDELVKSGTIPEQLLASPADPKVKDVYIPGQSQASPGANILIYEPVSYGGKVPFLAVNGSVGTLGPDELQQRLTAK